MDLQAEGQDFGEERDEPVDPMPNYAMQREDIRIANLFIDGLKTAKLDGSMDPAALHTLRNPPTTPLSLTPAEELSISIYLATTPASEQVYHDTRAAILKENPACQMLPHAATKALIARLSGVTAIYHDMCVDSCVGFTGPFSSLDACPMCGKSRYKSSHGSKKVPQKRFATMPIGPQLQALYRSESGALDMQYRSEYTNSVLNDIAQHGHKTQPYADFFDGSEYIQAVQDGRITEDDMCLVFSMDGAQLYRNKVSDCWLYIWIILDHSPQVRYKKKHVLPGGIIPGPKKPRNIDSLVFPGLYHLAAIQREGLQVYNGATNQIFTSRPFLALVTADGPAMACLNGCVGHMGKMHCRHYCSLVGRHKDKAPTYYPMRQKPHNYHVEGCDHEDVDIQMLLDKFTPEEAAHRYQENLKKVEGSRTANEYRDSRLETGICKPSIFSGISKHHILGIPACFGGDCMHLPCLNIPDLFFKLWRGVLDHDENDPPEHWDFAVLKGKVWEDHGQAIADTTPYIPGSFDRPPRNIALKINSGYKAWEYLLYLYGLGPCLLFQVLPNEYWVHYCRLVRAVRLLLQTSITEEDLQEANTLLTKWSDEFETLYVRRKKERIHFVRPSIHAISHTVMQTRQKGPGLGFAQWTIERIIGNLGEEIKQHSNPFQNLTQRAIRRCQVNALKAMIPTLEQEKRLPRGAYAIGDNYVMLGATEKRPSKPTFKEIEAIQRYLRTPVDGNKLIKIWKWARVLLPNGQIARTRWKEERKDLADVRMARNVKVRFHILDSIWPLDPLVRSNSVGIVDSRKYITSQG